MRCQIEALKPGKAPLYPEPQQPKGPACSDYYLEEWLFEENRKVQKQSPLGQGRPAPKPEGQAQAIRMDCKPGWPHGARLKDLKAWRAVRRALVARIGNHSAISLFREG